MNWLTKLAQMDAEPAPGFKLTLNDLRTLQKFMVEKSNMDAPGQGYLWDMPELQESRRSPAETVKNLQEIRKYFNDIFDEWGIGEHNIVEDNISKEELEDEVDRDLDMYLEEFDFKDKGNERGSPTWQFLDFLSDDDLAEAYRAAFNFEQLLENPGTSRRLFNRLMGEAKRWMEGNKAVGHAPDESMLQELVQTYMTYHDDPGASEEPLLDKISEMTTEVMTGTIERGVDSYHHSQDFGKLPKEDVPFWIDWEQLQEALNENFEPQLREWYKENKSSGLEESAEESIRENKSSRLSEIERKFEHEYNLNPEQLFGYYEREDKEDDIVAEDDPRWAIELYTVQDIASDLFDGDAAYTIRNAPTMVSTAFLSAAAIQKVIARDPTLTEYYHDEADNLQSDPDTIERAINWTLGINENELIPENETEEQLLDRQQKKIDNMKKRYKSIPDVLRADNNIEDFMANLMEEMQIKEQALIKRHWSLRSETGRLTEEELDRMQELGLARKPFPHRYIMERSTYPGAGHAEMDHKFHPFRITVAPEISADVIPPELFQTFSLHSMGTPGNMPEDPAGDVSLPAMGWIGGYADYTQQVMYIMEVQSDLMQRTSHMRDPKKLEQSKSQDIANLQNRLTQLERSLGQAQQGNPKQYLRQTVVRIRQENAVLDQSTPKFNQNLSRLEQLETQLSRMPDGAQDTSRIEQQIAEVTQQLQQSQGRSTDVENDMVYTKGNPADWHEYKSKIENLFKDWVPIFFNVAIREAKRREFKKVRIIDASSLAKIWSNYSDKATVELFKRVYDRTAVLRYNATHGIWNNYGFYEIDLQNPELRVAKMKPNWLQKVAQAQSAESWFTVNPNSGKMVWQEHIDAFFGSMQGELVDDVYDQTVESIEGPTQEFEGGYVDVDPMREENLSRIKDKNNIFDIWVRLVPPELKEGNDLSRDFKNQVRAHLLETQEFDPYQSAEVEDIETPSADSLEDMWR